MSKHQPGQVVVVTGSSGGIGRATAQAFAARGAKVAVLARGEEGLAGAARDVERAGGQALPIPTDTADPEQVEAAAAKAEDTLGLIDVWVNVAFTSVFAQFTDITPAEYRRVTEVNYLGYVYATMAVLKRMLPRDAGTIVQVGSALAYRGIPLQTAYCGSKHAIQGFHEALRCELLHNRSNVHVTMVQMPAVNTPQFDWVLSRLPRPAQPVPPSTSLSWPPAPSCTPLTTPDGASTGSAAARWQPWPPTPSHRACSTGTWLRRAFVPAGQPPGPARPARQPLAARRRTRRPRLHSTRQLRCPVQKPQPAAVGIPASRAHRGGRSRAAHCRRRRGSRRAGTAVKALPAAQAGYGLVQLVGAAARAARAAA